MGQRHQIYLALPFEVELPNGKMSKVIGLHNQWLYGRTALEQLLNALSFTVNQDKYGPFKCATFKESAVKAFDAIYSTNANGYFHEHYILDNEEYKNPDDGDNNDGITIIDARDSEKIKYCFMWLDYGDHSNVVKYKPLLAKEYLETYYGNTFLIRETEQKRNELDKDTSKTEEQRVAELKEHINDCVEWQNECIQIADEIDKLASLLSPNEVASIFPALSSKLGR